MTEYFIGLIHTIWKILGKTPRRGSGAKQKKKKKKKKNQPRCYISDKLQETAWETVLIFKSDSRDPAQQLFQTLNLRKLNLPVRGLIMRHNHTRILIWSKVAIDIHLGTDGPPGGRKQRGGREIEDEQRRHNVEQSINCVCPLSKCKDETPFRRGNTNKLFYFPKTNSRYAQFYKYYRTRSSKDVCQLEQPRYYGTDQPFILPQRLTQGGKPECRL